MLETGESFVETAWVHGFLALDKKCIAFNTFLFRMKLQKVAGDTGL
jgi:hypothetical protein